MPYLFQKRGIRVIYKGSIFVQKSIAVNPQRICKCHRYIVLNGVSVILIQNQCRGHNANLFCQFPCGETLECPVILQILARCGAFFIGFVVKGQMNHDFAFRIEVNPCVIEITIGKALYLSPTYLSRILNEKTERGFIGWLRFFRIQSAKELLSTTDNKHYEIAEAVGYHSYKVFSEHFLEETGLTISNWKTQNESSAKSD